jgi:hypothetical protein
MHDQHSAGWVFGPARHTVAVDWAQGGDSKLVRLLEEQAALRRVATLVARGTDRLGVFAAVAEEVGRRGHEHLAGGRHDQR